MTIPRKTLAAAVLLVFVSSALGQEAPKLYRWVSADGKVHYSDDLPPEALNEARQELSSKSGITLKQVDRAQTVEERTAAQAKSDADAKAAEAIEHAKQSDQVLLSSYPSENELKRAYDERIALQSETLKATRIGMDSQRQSLSGLLIAASNLELSGKPVNAKLVANIQTSHTQMIEQQQVEVQQKAVAENLRQESVAVLARYRSLRSAAEAAHSSTPAPTTPPPKG